MDKPISVGDLVVVLHQCCDLESQLGEIFRVTKIEGPHMFGCPCGWTGAGMGASGGDHKEGAEYGGSPLQWLKRIPPIEELEGEKRDEEIAA